MGNMTQSSEGQHANLLPDCKKVNILIGGKKNRAVFFIWATLEMSKEKKKHFCVASKWSPCLGFNSLSLNQSRILFCSKAQEGVHAAKHNAWPPAHFCLGRKDSTGINLTRLHIPPWTPNRSMVYFRQINPPGDSERLMTHRPSCVKPQLWWIIKSGTTNGR